MLGNLTFKAKLALGFAIICALLVLQAVITYSKVSTMNAQTRSIVEDRYPKVSICEDLGKDALNNGRLIRNLLILQAPEAAKSRDTIKALAEKDAALLDKLGKMIASEKGRRLFEAVQSARTQLNPCFDKFYGLAASDKAAATNFLITDFVAANNAYMNALENVTKYQQEMMAKASAEALTAGNSAQTTAIVVTLLALLLATATAIVLIRNLMKELGGEPHYALSITRIESPQVV